MGHVGQRGKLLGIVASRETVKKTSEKEAPYTQTLEVLQANLGKQARIVLHDKTIFQGKIRTVLTEPTASVPTPMLHRSRRQSSTTTSRGTDCDKGTRSHALRGNARPDALRRASRLGRLRRRGASNASFPRRAWERVTSTGVVNWSITRLRLHSPGIVRETKCDECRIPTSES